MDVLPGPLEKFLDEHGIPFPYLDPGDVAKLGQLISAFRDDFITAQRSSTAAVSGIAKAYDSTASQQMLAGWQNMWARNERAVTEACSQLEDAIILTAETLIGVQAAAIEFLTAVSIAYFARKVVKVGNIFDVSKPRVGDHLLKYEGLALRIVNDVIQLSPVGEVLDASQLADDVSELLTMIGNDGEQFIADNLINKGAVPFSEAADSALKTLRWSAANPGPAPKSKGFEMDASGVWTQVGELNHYAEEFWSDTVDIAFTARGLEFS